jgi:hypothetical protein
VAPPEQSLESLADFDQALTHFELYTNQKGRYLCTSLTTRYYPKTKPL